jgi:DNA-binding beta-propeller fold protein YncE
VPESILLVCNKHDDTMSFVDGQTYAILKTIPVGPNPHEIAITPDQRFAYISNYRPPGDTISVVDLVKRRHIGQINTGEYTRIHGAAMAPDGMAYFTAGQTGYVVEVDTATNQVTRGIPTHGKISHMVYVSPDGTQLFTANMDTRNISMIDRATAQLVKRISAGRGAGCVGFEPDGEHIWALNEEAGTINIIEMVKHTAVDTFDCPSFPVRIVFTRDGRRAFVACWSEQGELVSFDVKTRKETGRVRVGDQAIGLVLSPDEKHVLIGCEHTDGVHVVNTKTLKVEHRIHTGDGSDALAFWYPPEK